MGRLPTLLAAALALVVTSALSSTVLVAQATARLSQSDPSLSALHANWRMVIDNITAAAQELSEADYAYRPVATVRSIGELIGHVAGSQNLMCAAALGDPQPAEDAVERSATTKAALLLALQQSTAYCEKAYAIPASSAGLAIEMFGSSSTRAGALALNAVHDGEHYGNIVTYMRMKGMIPPSSKR